MNNIKILFYCLILFIISFFLIPLNTLDQNINVVNKKNFNGVASNTTYYDWGSTKTLSPEYSYSTLFYTENTRIHRLMGGYNYSERTLFGNVKIARVNINSGGKFMLAITNCAISKTGEMLDVVVTVDDVGFYPSDRGDRKITFEMRDSFPLIKSQTKPTTAVINHKVVMGDPILFGLGATYAKCRVTITYYKAGTYVYNSSSKTVTGELGEITHVNGIFSDIDVPTKDNNSGVFLRGNEGIRPNVGSSIIYYNINSRPPVLSSSFNKYLMSSMNNGVAITSANFSNGRRINPDGIWFATSALMLTKDISNSKYEFYYGGESCGIYYMFASPYAFEIDPPRKKASVEDALGGESYEYTVSQYIPNNYYGTLISFQEKYPNLYKNTRFKSIVISDDINEDCLILNGNDVRIVNEINEDASNFFDVKINGNKVTATAFPEALENYLFYNHTYNLIIPVTMKKGLYDIDFVANQAKTTSKIEDDPDKEDPSPEVDVKVRYSLTVNYYNEATGEKIEESDYNDQYFNGDPYTTNRDKVGEEWDLVDDPPNMNGVIHEDTVVNYYFIRFHTLPVTGGSGKKYIIIAGLVLILISLIIVLLKIRKILCM